MKIVLRTILADFDDHYIIFIYLFFKQKQETRQPNPVDLHIQRNNLNQQNILYLKLFILFLQKLMILLEIIWPRSPHQYSEE